MASSMLFGGCLRGSIRPTFVPVLRTASKQVQLQAPNFPSRFGLGINLPKSFHSSSLRRATSSKPPSTPFVPPRISKAKASLTSLLPFRRHVVVSPGAQIDTQTWQKFALYAVGIGGTVWALNMFLNRPTRERAFTDFERDYINKSFMYLGAGLGLTAVSARMMFLRGLPIKMMRTNPLVVAGLGIGGSMAALFGVMFTPPDRTVQRHAWWLAFNLCQAAVLSPLYFFNPAILSRAALYTVGVVGAMTYIGSTAREDAYLYLGGPLLAGLVVVALSSVAPLVLPATSMRALIVSETISLYGGLAVFTGLVLFDVQKMLWNARLAEEARRNGQEPPVDPMREAISLELDFINIFIRFVQMLAARENRK